MEYIQLIAILCSMAADQVACEDHYWDCYMRRGDLAECYFEEPYKNFSGPADEGPLYRDQ